MKTAMRTVVFAFVFVATVFFAGCSTSDTLCESSDEKDCVTRSEQLKKPKFWNSEERERRAAAFGVLQIMLRENTAAYRNGQPVPHDFFKELGEYNLPVSMQEKLSTSYDEKKKAALDAREGIQ